MPVYIWTKTASRRSPFSEPRDLAVASGPRPGALVAVLAAAVLLMSAPALVGALSIIDANLLAGARGWGRELSSWLAFIAHARVLLSLPLVGMVARAKENL